ncbi:MAG: hypothetical protein IJP35_08105 [Clostridia bacterium]|nr:hypothetical protein [Clostridia bacterium]
MNERDRLIDDILNEVSANRGVPYEKRVGHSERNADELINDILAEKTVKQYMPSAPIKAESAVAPKAAPAKTEKPKRNKKDQQEEDLLATITPWEDRHKNGRRGMTKEEAEHTVGDKETPGMSTVKNSQSFLQHLKRTAPTKKEQGNEVLYKKANAAPVMEEPAPAKEPSVLQDVHTDEWQAAVAGATRQMETTYEPTRMVIPTAKTAMPSTENATVPFTAAPKTKEKSGADEITGQVRLEGFDRPEQPLKPEQWESDFVSDRQDKIKNFKMEKDSLPEGEEPVSTHEDDGDYHTPADAPAIKYDLLARRRSVTARFAVTMIFAVIAMLFTAAGTLDLTYGLLSENPLLLLGLYAVVLILGVVCNLRLLWGGFCSLFRGGDQDTPTALAMLITLVQCALMLAITDHLPTNYPMMLMGCPALLGVALNLLGKRLMFSRIYRNMDLIGNDKQKQGVVSVSSKEEAFELGRGLSVGTPIVTLARTCVNLKDFIYHSYAPDLADRSARLPTLLSPAFGAVGALCAALFIPFDSAMQALVQIVSGFCGGMCIGLPLLHVLAGNFPLYRFCRRLFRQKIMLSGYDAVEQFKDTDVLAVDAAQLFPEGTVTLKSIKSATNQSLDRSIMDVAGVVYMADCPLKPLFRTILQDKTNLLPQVDTLVYEEEMGLSGWVMGYRVLVGTKKLMENHGILIPDTDFEEKYNEPGLRAVYLSTQGILSAVFLVKYTADEQIAEALRQAVANGVSLHIYSCDPNITREMICRMFRLPSAAVRIMGAVPRRLYKQQTDAKIDTSAVLSYEGDAGGFCRGISATIKLYRVIRMAAIVQTLLLLLGVVLFCLCTYLFGSVSGTLIVVYLLLSALFTLGLPALLGR